MFEDNEEPFPGLTPDPLTIRYFHPAGFFARLGTTYVRQEIAGLSEVPGDGRDDFVVVDAALGYRLPKRLGIMSLGVRDLLDEEFRFQDDSFRRRILVTGRTLSREIFEVISVLSQTASSLLRSH